MILNITPDHLDRHKTFANYVDAKARIFENQQADDFAVLNADDRTLLRLASADARAVVLVQPKERNRERSLRPWWQIHFRDAQGEREIMPVAEFRSRARTTSRTCWPEFRWHACRVRAREDSPGRAKF